MAAETEQPVKHLPMVQADGDDGTSTPERTNMMAVEQDAAIRLLQRQVKALQDYIDNRLVQVAGGMTVGVNWPK